MQFRQNALNLWLQTILPSTPFTIEPLSGDASFRRYFRVRLPDATRVVMDAPPEKESLDAFIAVNQLLKTKAIPTPDIHAINLEEGFLLLDDLGDCLLAQFINQQTSQALYFKAIDLIVQLQAASTSTLPLFDVSVMRQEVMLFEEWFLKRYLDLVLSDKELTLLHENIESLIEAIAQTPQVVMHRDYHSRNLMVVEAEKTMNLAVIDFQDAMIGPVAYDLVSLIKDCYIKLPTKEFNQYIDYFHQQHPALNHWTREALVRAIDFCGLQRHLKVLGIFCRLHLRDGKSGYLSDLPLTLYYVMTCLNQYPQWQPLLNFMQQRVIPQFKKVSNEAFIGE